MQKYVIALYIRLSIEDYKYDSLSIENQSRSSERGDHGVHRQRVQRHKF